MPASLTESITALTFPWYLCSLLKKTDIAGTPLACNRSPNNLPIFAAAATSLVFSFGSTMASLKPFSCVLAEAATVAVGV
ncbi:hypothetical protein FXO37_02400 [Capsicum annuum]|nr:hypothetical protein FXO37_02400 [Capsicum annuum]